MHSTDSTSKGMEGKGGGSTAMYLWVLTFKNAVVKAVSNVFAWYGSNLFSS